MFVLVSIVLLFALFSLSWLCKKRSKKIDSLISQDITRVMQEFKTTEAMISEHYQLSWKGTNPFRVITITEMLLIDFQVNNLKLVQALSSDYYGQTKHLLKKLKFLDACIFFCRHIKYSRLSVKKLGDMSQWTPSQLEVNTAHLFALSKKIPILGFLLFKELAMKPLLLALEKIDDLSFEKQRELALTHAVIASKLYSMMGSEHYKLRVKRAGLRRDHDENQLKRIAGHLKMSIDELFTYCRI